MLTTVERMQKILAAPPKVLARVDSILTGEDSTSGTPEVDLSTCTFTEAGRRLKLSRPTIYRLTRSGRIRTISLNGTSRIVVSSLVDFINGKAA